MGEQHLISALVSKRANAPARHSTSSRKPPSAGRLAPRINGESMGGLAKALRGAGCLRLGLAQCKRPVSGNLLS